MWTRLCNLQMECNIPPLYSRIAALKARVIARALSQPRDAPFVNRVKIELRRNPNFPMPNTWIAGMGRAARKCNLCEELLSRKPNNFSELYRGRAPWEDFQLHGTSQQKGKLHRAAVKGSRRRSYEKGVHRRMHRILHRRISGQQHSCNRSGSVFDELHRVLETIKHLLDSTNRTHSHSKSFRTLRE